MKVYLFGLYSCLWVATVQLHLNVVISRKYLRMAAILNTYLVAKRRNYVCLA